jgi:hypothetical protein
MGVRKWGFGNGVFANPRFLETRGYAQMGPPGGERFRPDNYFLDWLAGLIDGDGSFFVSKKGYVSCEISLHSKEVQALYMISKYFGGSVKKRTGVECYRWRLHKTALVNELALYMNGRLQDYNKRLQLKRVLLVSMSSNNTQNIKEDSLSRLVKRNWASLKNYNLDTVPKKISSNTSWISGFFDAEGSINCKQTTLQLCLSMSQKKPDLLIQIQEALKVGQIYFDKSWKGYIYYIISQKDLAEVFKYFDKFPNRIPPKKANYITLKRLWLFKERGYHLKSHPKHKDFLRLARLLANRNYSRGPQGAPFPKEMGYFRLCPPRSSIAGFGNGVFAGVSK